MVRVLIVDDAKTTRRFLRAVLDESGAYVVVGEAANGVEAVELATALQPDLVLLDLSMPEGEGADALPAMLRAVPRARVVVLSGQYRSVAAPLLAAGAAAYVEKGLPPAQLLARLAEIVGLDPEAAQNPPGRAARDLYDVPSRPRAVVCDADPMTRHLVGQVLAKCGVSVEAETDVVPALEDAVSLIKPEFVVLDLWLEGTSGTSAIPAMRAASPESQIVVFSPHEVWRERALSAGAVAFVQKPQFDQLEAVVSQLVARSRQRG